jgi:6-phospho-3-hexuloisomerase
LETVGEGLMSDYDKYRELILNEIRTALEAADGSTAVKLAERIIASRKVFLIGVGRVFLSLKAFAKRLNHLGIQAYCVGDINEPALTGNDLLIVGSGSGESIVPVAITKKAKELGASIAHLGSNPQSTMKVYTDLFIRIPVATKLGLPGEIQSRQIMSSLFEQSLLLLGDIVCCIIAERKNIMIKNLWECHANLE